MEKRVPFKVLFLCTGNSARSIIAEYLLRKAGPDRFEVHSAGSFPTGRVNPFAVRVLAANYHIDASGARSKSLHEFESMQFDLIITVCDNARESCPIWPGHPVVAHWGIPDPALIEGSDATKLQSFNVAAEVLARRINALVTLPLETLDHQTLTSKVQQVAETDSRL